MSRSSRNSVKRESEDESMATPTGPSDEPTDLSVGGGREREERDRERQERERYYRWQTLSMADNMKPSLPRRIFVHPCLLQSIDGALQHRAGFAPARKKRRSGRATKPLWLPSPDPPGLHQDRVALDPIEPLKRSSAQHLHLVQWVGDRLISQHKSTAIKTQWKLCCQSEWKGERGVLGTLWKRWWKRT